MGEMKKGSLKSGEIGMDMYEYRCICGYEDILVLLYR